MNFTDILVAFFLLLGSVAMFLSSVGMLRFRDVFLRMHAATKSSSFGIGCIMIGVALFFADSLLSIRLIALLLIYLLTVPVGAQVLAHAAHVARVRMAKETWVDDLAPLHYRDDIDEQASADENRRMEV